MNCDLEFLKAEILGLGRILGRTPTKQEVDGLSTVPSYNTCLRRGVSLFEIGRTLRQELFSRACKECDEPIPPEKRWNYFCNSSCSATFNNSNSSRVPHCSEIGGTTTRARQVAKPCECCGSDVLGAGRFCSVECHIEEKFSSKLESWLNGGELKATNPTIRKFLTRLHGYACFACGVEEWNQKKITLEVEHISGDSSDSSPGNVCLLCPNCHSQTPTYKGRNKGQGRHARRLRYSEGKSY